MAMVWNTSTKGMCIVHEAWHVRTEKGFVLSLLVVFALGVGYELLKLQGRLMELALVHTEEAQGVRLRRDGEEVSAWRARPMPRRVMPVAATDLGEADIGKRPIILSYVPTGLQTPSGLRVLHTILYGAQVALSCFLMLVMMTYNAWLIGAIVAGAMAGALYVRSMSDVPVSDVRGAVCH